MFAVCVVWLLSAFVFCRADVGASAFRAPFAKDPCPLGLPEILLEILTAAHLLGESLQVPIFWLRCLKSSIVYWICGALLSDRGRVPTSAIRQLSPTSHSCSGLPEGSIVGITTMEIERYADSTCGTVNILRSRDSKDGHRVLYRDYIISLC